jgi:hypothetical protein
MLHTRFGKLAWATGLACIIAAAFAGSASAYTLEPGEARYIATWESDFNYKFRGVFSWGGFADDVASHYIENSFERETTDSVIVRARRNWFGCNPENRNPPTTCGYPTASYVIQIHEWTPGKYDICVNSGNSLSQPNYPLAYATSCFSKSA